MENLHNREKWYIIGLLTLLGIMGKVFINFNSMKGGFTIGSSISSL